jgi:NADH dehydrogenase [ubiquinone] 1 alpha subcomplex assembly factor 7
VSGSGLADRIARRIRAEGPMSLAAYMAMALHDPEHGYYRRREPIGAAGDFVTAPEISQVFGELIGLWCADMWRLLGRPDPVILCELGPGTGAMMGDLLRAAAVVPGFREAMRLHLVEASPGLRAEQQRRLGAARPVWVERVEALPEGTLLLVANEFLDALPVRQFVRGRREWRERLVGLDARGRLVLVDGPEDPALGLFVPQPRRAAPPGAVAELCPAALGLAAALGARLRRQPGAALFIDYGYGAQAPGPSLGAVREHRSAALLHNPGSADISAHVDFAAFAEAARGPGADTHGPVPQGRFLAALGAAARLEALRGRATPEQRQVLESGVARLLDPAQMGTLFQVIALTSPGLPPPPGFGIGNEREPG